MMRIVRTMAFAGVVLLLGLALVSEAKAHNNVVWRDTEALAGRAVLSKADDGKVVVADFRGHRFDRRFRFVPRRHFFHPGFRDRFFFHDRRFFHPGFKHDFFFDRRFDHFPRRHFFRDYY